MKAIFLHCMPRNYRVPLFMELSKRIEGLKFIFTCGRRINEGDFNEIRDIENSFKELNKAGVNSSVVRDIPNPIFREEFNPSIFWDVLDADVVVASIPYRFSGIFSFFLSKLSRKRYVVWDETWMLPDNLRYKLVKPLLGFIARHADACVVAGSAAKNFYSSLGCKEKNIYVANNSALGTEVPPSLEVETKKIKRKCGMGPENFVYAYLGRIVPYKGLDLLIEAFSRLEKDNPQAFLLIGGTGNPEFEQYCKSLSSRLGIKNICFYGYVEEKEKAPFLKSSDFFVLPGRFMPKENVCCEAWGLTLNEAASLSLPLLSSTSVGAAYDIIEEGRNGFIAEAGNAESMFKAMKSALNSDLDSFSRHSAKISEKFNYKHMADVFQMTISEEFPI